MLNKVKVINKFVYFLYPICNARENGISSKSRLAHAVAAKASIVYLFTHQAAQKQEACPQIFENKVHLTCPVYIS